MKIFNGIPSIKEVFSTSIEWHVFLEGLAEPFCFWWHKPMTLEENEQIMEERHYYKIGKAVSATAIVAIFTAIGLLVWRKRK